LQISNFLANSLQISLLGAENGSPKNSFVNESTEAQN
jgi:hypothetical protein